ncbi:MAG: SPASM domain-containing protein [Candidatus Omnitrophica bacterium]|nr:SPASM domain-containing protein [Candidatus Omnitrophota bacterium]
MNYKKELKLSQYTIIWKEYVYNTRQRSLLFLPINYIEFLKNGEFYYLPDKILEILQIAGILLDKKIDEELLFEFWLARQKMDTTSLHVAFIPTYQCNCRCVYCYADWIRSPIRNLNLQINKEDIIKWLYSSIKILKIRELDFAFHGGEPLLLRKYVINIASKINEICEELGLKKIFSIVTNGTLLSPAFVQEIQKFSFNRALVTLDGLPSFHDIRRPFISGKGTFEIIFSNIKKALDLGMDIVLGYNFDKQNFQNIPEFLDFLLKNGFDNYKNFRLIFGAVRKGPEPVNPEYFKSYEMSKAEAGKTLLWAYNEALRRGIRIVEPLGFGLCTFKTAWVFMIDYKGDIFKCITLAGRPESWVGTIYEPFEIIAQRTSQFAFLEPWRKFDKCRKCIYLPMCFGGCYQQALLKSEKKILGEKIDCMRELYDALFPDVLQIMRERLIRFPEFKTKIEEQSTILLQTF